MEDSAQADGGRKGLFVQLYGIKSKLISSLVSQPVCCNTLRTNICSLLTPDQGENVLNVMSIQKEEGVQEEDWREITSSVSGEFSPRLNATQIQARRRPCYRPLLTRFVW